MRQKRVEMKTTSRVETGQVYPAPAVSKTLKYLLILCLDPERIILLPQGIGGNYE